jgi:hypothetical protein
MRRTIFLAILVLIASTAFAYPPSPEWMIGSWEADDGTVWEWEAINAGNEGILTIYEDGEIRDFWGWRWMGNDTYHIKRYYSYFESFVVYVRGNNEFLIRNFRDANTSWVLNRMGDQREEWEESL